MTASNITVRSTSVSASLSQLASGMWVVTDEEGRVMRGGGGYEQGSASKAIW
jgi:hypothetical protein